MTTQQMATLPTHSKDWFSAAFENVNTSNEIKKGI